jgi:thymidylate synthase (FAD)
MNLIFNSSIYVVGRQTIESHDLDRFLSDHEVGGWETDSEVGAEVLSETAGRVCYMSFAKPRPGGNSAYLQHIKEVGHGSVLEHSVWNFIFTGISRSLSHELVRHRAGFGYSQLSQRYVDESVCDAVVPDDLKEEVKMAMQFIQYKEKPIELDAVNELLDAGHSNAHALTAGLLWIRNMLQSNSDYKFLSDYLFQKLSQGRPVPTMKEAAQSQKTEIRKGARQAARSVLPNATETKIIVTANARAIRHFLEQRGALPAEPEIRNLAIELCSIMKKEAPNLFGDYRIMETPFGKQFVETNYRKV